MLEGSGGINVSTNIAVETMFAFPQEVRITEGGLIEVELLRLETKSDASEDEPESKKFG